MTEPQVKGTGRAKGSHSVVTTDRACLVDEPVDDVQKANSATLRH
jgi:hypothetical protein